MAKHGLGAQVKIKILQMLEAAMQMVSEGGCILSIESSQGYTSHTASKVY